MDVKTPFLHPRLEIHSKKTWIVTDGGDDDGNYYGGDTPDAGLAVARMAAHITYLSEAGLTDKFGRRLQDRDTKSFGFDADFQVESYLRYQGSGFTQVKHLRAMRWARAHASA